MMLDLEPIKERLKAATPGPWRWAHGPNWDNFQEGDDVQDSLHLLTIAEHPLTFMEGTLPTTVIGYVEEPCEYTADLPFIASSITDMAALIEEVERLRGVLETIRDPYFSDDEYVSAEGCPSNPCPACHRQEQEAFNRAHEALYGNAHKEPF